MGLLVAVDLIILITYTIVLGVRGQLAPEKEENGENPMDMEGVSKDDLMSALNFNEVARLSADRLMYLSI